MSEIIKKPDKIDYSNQQNNTKQEFIPTWVFLNADWKFYNKVVWNKKTESVDEYKISNFIIHLKYTILNKEWKLRRVYNFYNKKETVEINITNEFASLFTFRQVIQSYWNFIFSWTQKDLDEIFIELWKNEKRITELKYLWNNKWLWIFNDYLIEKGKIIKQNDDWFFTLQDWKWVCFDVKNSFFDFKFNQKIKEEDYMTTQDALNLLTELTWNEVFAHIMMWYLCYTLVSWFWWEDGQAGHAPILWLHWETHSWKTAIIKVLYSLCWVKKLDEVKAKDTTSKGFAFSLQDTKDFPVILDEYNRECWDSREFNLSFLKWIYNRQWSAKWTKFLKVDKRSINTNLIITSEEITDEQNVLTRTINYFFRKDMKKNGKLFKQITKPWIERDKLWTWILQYIKNLNKDNFEKAKTRIEEYYDIIEKKTSWNFDEFQRVITNYSLILTSLEVFWNIEIKEDIINWICEHINGAKKQANEMNMIIKFFQYLESIAIEWKFLSWKKVVKFQYNEDKKLDGVGIYLNQIVNVVENYIKKWYAEHTNSLLNNLLQYFWDDIENWKRVYMSDNKRVRCVYIKKEGIIKCESLKRFLAWIYENFNVDDFMSESEESDIKEEEEKELTEVYESIVY